MGSKPSVPKPLDWKEKALLAHNRLRKIHNAPPLTYSKDLSLQAQNHALYLQTRSKLIRSGMYCQSEHVGENLAEKTFGRGIKEYTGEDATEDWYKENKYYDFLVEGDPDAETKAKCRNFTQLIWRGSKEVGFGKTTRGKRVIVVANYFPAGNIKGRYAKNVFPSEAASIESFDTDKEFPETEEIEY